MSPQRKFRLARTGVILLVLIVIIAKCSGNDSPTKKADNAPSRTSTTTTTAPSATTLNAKFVDATLPKAHYGTGAAAVVGKILMPGGLDEKRRSSLVVWQFDPSSSATANIARLPTATRNAAVATIGDTVWMFGGASKAAAALTTTVSIDAAGAVSSPGKLPAARVDAAAVGAADGASIYIVGGYNGKDNVTGTNEILRTTDGVSFTTVATLPQSVRQPAVVLYDKSLFVIGGVWGANQQAVSSIQRIDLANGNASVVGELPEGLSGASAMVIDKAIFVAGGRTSKTRSDKILRIDPVSAVVSQAGRLPTPLSDAMSAVVGDTGYLLGGLTPDLSDRIIELHPS